jgi:hypothetical protein
MHRNTEIRLSEKVIAALGDVPPLPGHLYGAMMKKIDGKKALTRSLWALAASLLIAVIPLTVFRATAPYSAYNSEVAEELASISSYYTGDGIQYDDESNYENVLYQP